MIYCFELDCLIGLKKGLETAGWVLYGMELGEENALKRGKRENKCLIVFMNVIDGSTQTSKTKQNKTKQNKTKQNKTKQNKNKTKR